MKTLWLLTRLRVQDLLRTRSSLAFFLGVPLLLLIAVGGIFPGGHPFERRQVGLVQSATAPLPPHVLALLSQQPELVLRTYQTLDQAVADLDRHLLEALVVSDGSTLSWTVPADRPLLGQALARLLAAPPPASADLPARADSPDAAHVSLRTRPVPRLGYLHYLVPGLLTMNLFVAGLLGMGSGMARYRQSGLLKKLALTPLSRTTFVAAQLLSRTGLGLAQILLLLIAARLFLALPLSLPAFLHVLFWSTVGLLCFMGLGFLTACWIHSEAILLDFVSLTMTPVVLLSEMFFPVSELPAWLRLVGDLLPSTQLVRLFRMCLGGAVSPDALVIPGGILLAWLVVSFFLSTRLFSWHRS